MAKKNVHILEEPRLSSEVCALVVDRSQEAIRARGSFSIGFSGGSVAKMLCNGLSPNPAIDWNKWQVFFCDERLVPFDDEDSTYRIYKAGLFDRVSIPADLVHAIDPSLPVEAAAENYASQLKTVAAGSSGFPALDLLILGMGPDGHTCSLFPGHQLLQEATLVCAPISDSPKPPPRRITMTLPVVNQTRCALFVSTGASKAAVIKRVLEGDEVDPLPAARVQPHSGELHWFLDTAAAGNLSAKY